MNDTNEPQPPNDPAKAFNDLRSEVRVLRRAVEDWHEAMTKNPPSDYKEHYTGIRKAFQFVTDQLEELKKPPAEPTPSAANLVQDNLDEAKKQLIYASNIADKERDSLRTLIGTVNSQRVQKQWLIRAGIGGVAVGLVLFYVLARVLPFGVDTFIAASIIGENRWDAGLALLRKSDPDNWQKLIDDTKLVAANRDKIDGCRATAAKSKKDENCTINVSPPNS